MVESCQYSYFGDFSSPICCDDSSDLIFPEAAIEVRNTIKATIEADLADAAQSKLKSTGENSQAEKETIIISKDEGSASKLLGFAEPVEKTLAPSVIEADVADAAQSKLKSTGENSQAEKETIIISKDEGSASKLLGFAEPVEKTLAPSMIISAKEKIPLEIDPENVIINRSGEFEPNLHGSAEPVDGALARSVIISSEEKSPFNIEKETTQATNANQVKEKRKRKKRKSKNGDEDPWLPAGWKMIEKYRKKGKLAGYVYKTYKAPDVRKSFRSKQQALEHIKNQKLDGVDR